MADSDQSCDVPIYTVDAFTDVPFGGNPAAVCLLPFDTNLSEDTLQKIAAEMNLSETSFVQAVNKGDDFVSGSKFTIRWFTPTSEVPLCGHATLASSAVIFFCKNNDSSSITFSSKSGPLTTRVNANTITMDFPLNRTEPFDKADVTSLINVSGSDSSVSEFTLLQEVCDLSLIKDTQYSPSTKKLLLRLHDHVTRETLESLSPDIRALQACETTGLIRGVIVTVKNEGQDSTHGSNTYDFLSRYFAPWVGIDEDPVTGSAHTVLADYWSKHLGKTTLKARQCSKRGGDLDIKVIDDRVELSGKARVVLSGVLKL